MRTVSLLLASLLISVASAKTWFIHDKYVLNSCNSAMLKQTKYCMSMASYGFGSCACVNQAAMATVMQCLYDRNETDMDVLLSRFESNCASAGITVTDEQLLASYANATDYWIDLNDPPAGFNHSEMNYHPVKNGNMTSYYTGYYVAAKIRFTNKDNSQFLGMGFLGLWCVILLCAISSNILSKVFPRSLNWFNGIAFRKFRSLVGMPAVYHKSHIQSVGIFGYLPTRLEAVIIAVNTVYLVLATCIGYTYDDRDLTFTERAALGRYIGDRSCIIASYMTPLVFLFAGRNNFLQWLTGWNFSVFATYHKWLARLYVIEVIVHSGAMAINSMAYGKWTSRLAAPYYRWGIAGTVASGFIIIFSVFCVRRASYEAFLIAHIVLAAIFLAASWLHVAGLSYLEYYYAAAAVWILDAVVRIARLAVFGVRKSRVELVEMETLKISVERPSHWLPYPGAHGFVYFITPALFFQSHPFTFVASQANDTKHIHFYVKVKNGATRSLARRVLASGSTSCTIPIAVEGPYAEKSDYQHYSKALLIAGGNGIPGPFSHAAELAKSDCKTEIKLYWSIREYHSLKWFFEELLTLKNTRVQVIVYVTNPDSKLDVFDSSSESSSTQEKRDYKDIEISVTDPLEKFKSELSFVEFRTGRMNLEQTICNEVEESTGSIAVGVCGHPAMADQARAVTAALVGECEKRVDYFEEMQIW